MKLTRIACLLGLLNVFVACQPAGQPPGQARKSAAKSQRATERPKSQPARVVRTGVLRMEDPAEEAPTEPVVPEPPPEPKPVTPAAPPLADDELMSISELRHELWSILLKTESFDQLSEDELPTDPLLTGLRAEWAKPSAAEPASDAP